MTYRNRDVEKTLLNKFHFVQSKTHSDDHRWVELTLPDLPVIVTHFSHAKEDIGDTLWKLIARQLRVNTSFLNGMISCTKSRDDYYNQVKTAPMPLPGHRS
jgi:hypothetical protein